MSRKKRFCATTPRVGSVPASAIIKVFIGVVDICVKDIVRAWYKRYRYLCDAARLMPLKKTWGGCPLALRKY